ncbi:MAG: DUF4440 domain-containing protein [Ferruginibacter sp.]
MKKNHGFVLAGSLFLLSIFASGCNNKPEEQAADAAKTAETTMQAVPAKPDLAKLKTEIQALETAWAAADNARDTNALAAFYADDAVSMSNNKPMLVGKAAIAKDIAISLPKKDKGSTVSYDVMDVYGNDDCVTETGKSTSKDAAGKVIYTGKYMAIWEKRNGKFLCVREIYNDDVKAK